MKKLFIISIAAVVFAAMQLVLPLAANAQAPEKMSYQAVIRNGGGALVRNSNVGVRIQILKGSESGAAVYVETHTAATNGNGLVTLQIGGGTMVTGTMAGIDWSADSYYIKTETDPAGGANYIISGTTQLLSVPYALYSKASGTPGPVGPKGDKGDQGDAGPTGPAGADGANGADGADGTNGTNGTDGADGKTVLSGATDPGTSLGTDGDFYINTSASKIFGPKTSGAWGSGTALIGPQGSQGNAGTNGATWTTGTGAPATSSGSVNDLYLDAGNGDYYLKTASSTWTKQGNLIGPTGSTGSTGSTGTAGATWHTGSGAPGTTTGTVGDLYLNTSNSDYYKKTASSTWTLQGNLAGSANISGTSNYVTKFTAANTGGNSQLYDNGTSVGINTTSPAGKLNVKGSTDASVLTLDANSTQSITNPLVRLRNSGGTDLLWLNSDHANNVFLGVSAGRSNNSGSGGTSNTFVGGSAGYSNTTGDANTATGFASMYNNSTGTHNTATGFGSLNKNTTGKENTATGTWALLSNTTGTNNTASGLNSLHDNTLGSFNSAFGSSALYSNTTASRNIAVGNSALYTQSFSNSSTAWTSDNVAIGYEALYSNQPTATSNGKRNTAVGNYALRSNTTGMDNTAIGTDAMKSNTKATENTAVGAGALLNNSTAGSNVAIGPATLYTQSYSNSSASWHSYNIAIGGYALYLNEPTSSANGIENIAIGYSAMTSNTTGSYNTTTGVNAMLTNTTGNDNTAYGNLSLYSNSTGSNNTGIGKNALSYLSTQSNNTALGYSAGDLYTMTSGTFIGASAYPGNNSYTNIMGLGYNARPSASNSVVVGNSSVTSIGGYANWSNLSDKRYKKNVQENVPGLEFIKLLKPVTYQLEVNKLAVALKEDQKRDAKGNIIPVEPDAFTKASRDAKERMIQTGFLAQDVEDAARSIGYNFSGVDAPENENDFYALRYADFVVPLVKAVQEQQEIIETQNQKLEEMQRQIAELKLLMEKEETK